MTNRTPERVAPEGRGDRRRAELLQAAMDCVAREGWPGLTHRKVAQHAGANAGLVHYYFGNLAGLRSAIARHASDHLILPVAEALCATTTVDQLIHTAVQITEASLDDPDGVRLLTQMITGAAHYPDVAAVVAADMTAAKARFAGHLVDLDSEWSMPGAITAAGLFIGALDGIVLHALTFGPDAAAPAAQLERLFRAVLTAPR
ncbi:TetR/AcrR family transcriptional regulator [Lysobacter korlensis]|uniref:TetR/AcrR family transcriptional regulator n=1 Tax=Lysobacter korlensis TaxID=553636 RepID=A0ABV6RWJ8_9GAMM